MRVLVVDDDEISSLIIADNLRELGYEVTTAQDGEEGWEVFTAEEFPIIILDWMMPRLDGIGLCRRIRHQFTKAYTYIILLTGRTEREDRLEALESGADDFLIKPLDTGELRARLGVAARILESEQALRDVRNMEMALGADIQRKLLFGAPPVDIEGLHVDSISIPSKSVAGDFLDYYPYANGIVDVVVGDVMGKGVPAAMVAAGIKSALEKSLLSLLSRGAGLPPLPEVLQSTANRVVAELISLNTYATLCYARFYGAQRRLAYINCGHPNLIRWNALKDRCELLPNSTVPLGFLEDATFPEHEIELGIGDLICLYSDGISDVFGGPEELAEWLQPRASLPLEEIRGQLSDSALKDQPKDDSTFVLVRATGVLDSQSPIAWSEYGALRKARETIRLIAEGSYGLDSDAAGELILAVQEAGSNALRHARPGHRNLPFGFKVVDLRDSVRVELRYPGELFHPGDIASIEPDPTTEGGFGLAIIAKCVDEYVFGREGDWNVVSLVKRKAIKSEG
jgi:sigma-B regulation protein RsbU (phosphoserine phosphatase)